MKIDPQKEHNWLHRLIGEWTFEGEASMGPDQPPHKSQGTESVRSMEGIWILGEGQSRTHDGAQFSSLLTLGYDTARKRFVGSWIGSCMTNLWVYDGALDASGNVLTLDSEGPAMSGDGTTAKYQDIIEIKDEDHRILSSQVLGADGKWQRFMTAHYYRKK